MDSQTFSFKPEAVKAAIVLILTLFLSAGELDGETGFLNRIDAEFAVFKDRMETPLSWGIYFTAISKIVASFQLVFVYEKFRRNGALQEDRIACLIDKVIRSPKEVEPLTFRLLFFFFMATKNATFQVPLTFECLKKADRRALTKFFKVNFPDFGRDAEREFPADHRTLYLLAALDASEEGSGGPDLAQPQHDPEISTKYPGPELPDLGLSITRIRALSELACDANKGGTLADCACALDSLTNSLGSMKEQLRSYSEQARRAKKEEERAAKRLKKQQDRKERARLNEQEQSTKRQKLENKIALREAKESEKQEKRKAAELLAIRVKEQKRANALQVEKERLESEERLRQKEEEVAAMKAAAAAKKKKAPSNEPKSLSGYNAFCMAIFPTLKKSGLSSPLCMKFGGALWAGIGKDQQEVWNTFMASHQTFVPLESLPAKQGVIDKINEAHENLATLLAEAPSKKQLKELHQKRKEKGEALVQPADASPFEVHSDVAAMFCSKFAPEDFFVPPPPATDTASSGETPKIAPMEVVKPFTQEAAGKRKRPDDEEGAEEKEKAKANSDSTDLPPPKGETRGPGEGESGPQPMEVEPGDLPGMPSSFDGHAPDFETMGEDNDPRTAKLTPKELTIYNIGDSKVKAAILDIADIRAAAEK